MARKYCRDNPTESLPLDAKMRPILCLPKKPRINPSSAHTSVPASACASAPASARESGPTEAPELYWQRVKRLQEDPGRARALGKAKKMWDKTIRNLGGASYTLATFVEDLTKWMKATRSTIKIFILHEWIHLYIVYTKSEFPEKAMYRILYIAESLESWSSTKPFDRRLGWIDPEDRDRRDW